MGNAIQFNNVFNTGLLENRACDDNSAKVYYVSSRHKVKCPVSELIAQKRDEHECGKHYIMLIVVHIAAVQKRKANVVTFENNIPPKLLNPA